MGRRGLKFTNCFVSKGASPVALLDFHRTTLARFVMQSLLKSVEIGDGFDYGETCSVAFSSIGDKVLVYKFERCFSSFAVSKAKCQNRWVPGVSQEPLGRTVF